MKRADYPDGWEALTWSIKMEQGWRCLWCGAKHYEPHPITGSRVVLTTAHLDHDPQNNDRLNLAALCQRCHLRHDHKQHMANAARTRREKKRNHEMDLKGVSK